MPENIFIWQLISEELSPVLFNGMGGVNHGAIDMVFRMHGMEPGSMEYNENYRKVLVFINVVREVNEQKKDG